MYLQYSRYPYLSPFAKCSEGVVHHSACPSLLMFLIERPIEWILVLYRVPRNGFFAFGEEILIAWTYIMRVPVSPISSGAHRGIYMIKPLKSKKKMKLPKNTFSNDNRQA